MIEFTGDMAGDEIVGKFTQGGGTIPLTLKKGDYITPAYSLNLSKEAMDQLLGSWSGKLETPGGSLTVVFRFEMNETGEFVGFTDSPDQGGFGIPITGTTYEAGNVTIEVSSLQAGYKGEITGNEMDGEFTQRGMSFPLALIKGE